MSVQKIIVAFGLGVPIGFLIAINLALGGDEKHGFRRFADIIEWPVLSLLQLLAGSDAARRNYFLLTFHIGFWILLVVSLILGVAVFFSWLVKHDD